MSGWDNLVKRICSGESTKRCQSRAFEIVAVKKIVGVERNQSAIGMDDMDAGLFDAADIKSVRVDKLHDQHTEDILIAEFRGRSNFRQAAEEFTQGIGAGLRRMVRGEKFEQTIADALLLFVDDRITSGVDEHVRRDEPRERHNLAFDFQRVRHGQRIGMAGHGNDVLGLKDLCLLENLAADLGKGESIRRGVEPFQAARILNRLQRHSSHARLLQRVVNRLAYFLVI